MPPERREEHTAIKARIATLMRRLESLEWAHRPSVWLVQFCIFVLSGVTAFLLRFDGNIPPVHLQHLFWGLSVWVVVKSVVFRLCGLDRGWWRFVSIDDVLRLGFGNLMGSAVSFLLIWLLAPQGFPRSIYLLDFLICFLGTSGIRVTIRMLRDSYWQNERGKEAQCTLIYGAGQAGITLLREIRANPKLPYSVCGFVDDNPEKLGLVIHGVKVLGGKDRLCKISQKHSVATVLIAIPSASGTEMCGILRRCREAGVSYKTVPGLAEVIGSNNLASHIRDVAVEDVLGRTPVRLEEERIEAKLAGKVVLVTGAAGSIGSELCKQIARFEPAAIVAFEVAESPLFELEREMRRIFPHVSFHMEIGSIRNLRRLAEVFHQHSPSLVYHAAAYKHVPMMEAHVFEAIENNFFGTYNVAMTAAERGTEDFVLISSDKAVRPTSVMGVTKRMAELIVLSLESELTRFVAVRFGNVLGSNGSVIPIFKKQIAAGGPVTVTHPDMRRYFMTVPEAAQLVLQASAMGKGGEIFTLDMGDPVKIVDLARNLILLSGLQPDEDIKIEFTGIRPGEKLYEELNRFDEDVIPTSHAKIKIFAKNGLPERNMESHMAALCEICTARDLGQLIMTLKEIVPDYNPSSHLLRRVIRERPTHIVAATA